MIYGCGILKGYFNSFVNSLKQNKKGIILMIISSVFGCIGQLFWKFYTTEGFLFLLLGLAFFAVGAVFMIISYRHGPLSVLQPMLGTGYALSIILAAIFLDEPITAAKAIGVLLIIFGLLLIGGGSRND